MQLAYCYTFYVVCFLSTINNMVDFICCAHQTTTVMSLTKSLVWGPGLDVEVVLPVRYFFIQPVDNEGQKYVLFMIISLEKWQYSEHQKYCS